MTERTHISNAVQEIAVRLHNATGLPVFQHADTGRADEFIDIRIASFGSTLSNATASTGTLTAAIQIIYSAVVNDTSAEGGDFTHRASVNAMKIIASLSEWNPTGGQSLEMQNSSGIEPVTPTQNKRRAFIAINYSISYQIGCLTS